MQGYLHDSSQQAGQITNDPVSGMRPQMHNPVTRPQPCCLQLLGRRQRLVNEIAPAEPPVTEWIDNSGSAETVLVSIDQKINQRRCLGGRWLRCFIYPHHGIITTRPATRVASSSDCFENDRNTLPHADAHRRQTKTHLLLVHGMQQRRGNAGPTGPEWVANCQTAPMDIHLLTIDS